MNQQTLFLIIMVLILLYLLPNSSNLNILNDITNIFEAGIERRQERRQDLINDINQIMSGGSSSSGTTTTGTTSGTTTSSATTATTATTTNTNTTTIMPNMNLDPETSSLVNEYLQDNICPENQQNIQKFDNIEKFGNSKKTYRENFNKENFNKENFNKEHFDTMGPGMNIGNNMNFPQQTNQNPSQLDISLSKSLVPDFQPNALNINDDLNSYGYATNNPDTDKYYEQRGFMNPILGANYADSVQYMLSHPYQTRYCDKQN